MTSLIRAHLSSTFRNKMEREREVINRLTYLYDMSAAISATNLHIIIFSLISYLNLIIYSVYHFIK